MFGFVKYTITLYFNSGVYFLHSIARCCRTARIFSSVVAAQNKKLTGDSLEMANNREPKKRITRKSPVRDNYNHSNFL
jgi:hypothetical protein